MAFTHCWGEHTHNLDATCFFLQPPPCPVQHSPHAEPQKQSKACRSSSITQILCKYKHQVPGLDHRVLQDTGRAEMEKHASAVTSGTLLPSLSCSWPKCTHKAAQEGRTAWNQAGSGQSTRLGLQDRWRERGREENQGNLAKPQCRTEASSKKIPFYSQ